MPEYTSKTNLLQTLVMEESPITRFFIAESMTTKNKELFKKCLDARKSLNYKFIWINQGRIYLRKSSDTPAKLIAAVKDIDNLT